MRSKYTCKVIVLKKSREKEVPYVGNAICKDSVVREMKFDVEERVLKRSSK